MPIASGSSSSARFQDRSCLWSKNEVIFISFIFSFKANSYGIVAATFTFLAYAYGGLSSCAIVRLARRSLKDVIIHLQLNLSTFRPYCTPTELSPIK